MAAPTVVLTVPYNPLNGQQPPSFAIPSTASLSGKRAFVVVQQASTTVPILPPDASWTQVGTPQVMAGAVAQRSYLFTKVLQTSDLGTTPQFTYEGGVLMRGAGILIVTNGSTDLTESSMVWAEGFTDPTATTWQIHRMTSAVDEELQIAVETIRWTAGTGIDRTVAAPTAWTEIADFVTSNTTGPLQGMWAGTRARGVGSATTQTPAANTTHTAAAVGGYVIMVKPAAAVSTVTKVYCVRDGALAEIKSVLNKNSM